MYINRNVFFFSGDMAGNPMPIEMMQTSPSLPSSNCPPSLVNSGSPVTGNSSKNGPKKERTCKGKRYLDMINESKTGTGTNPVNQPGGKKCKNSSGESGESPIKDGSKNSSSGAGGGSKWVSGGFDLEEHIAALPQLGDAHLLTALNNSKNKGTVVNGNVGGNHGHGHHHNRQGRNNSDLESDGSRSPSSPSGHHGERRDAAAAFNQIISNKSDSESSSSEPCLKIGEDPMSVKSNGGSGSISSRTNSPINNLTNGHGSPISKTNNLENESSSTTSDQKRSMVARELLASAGFNLSRSSQGIEVGPCDGLAALAEVALSQAQAISTTTSS